MKTNRRTLVNRIHSSAKAVAIALTIVAPGCMEFSEPAEIQLQNHVEDWREEVIYQVLVDRFADGDWGNNFSIFPSAPGKWHGGDWKGLEEKLDYLEGLGVTTIWISPIVKNVYTDAGFDAYHGYWAQDLTQLAPQFGDLESLRSLVDSAHERKMKIVLDIVTNHLGQLFYYDINGNGQADDPLSISRGKDIYKENEYDPTYDVRGVQAFTSLGESGLADIIFAHDPASNHMPPYPEIFQNKLAYNRKGRTYNFDDPDQLRRGDFPGGLKDVNTELCPIREAMVDAYARWIELTDIDGFRIDTVKHVERGFWRYFGYKVRERLHAKGKTNFFMFGEAFDGRDPLVGSYTKNGSELPLDDEAGVQGLCADDLNGDQLDSVFYFPQQFQVVRDVFRYRGPTANIQRLYDDRKVNYGNTPALRGPVDAAGTGISPQKMLVNFLDNHDVPRFLFTGAGNYPEDPIFATPLPIETRRSMLHNALLYLMTWDGIPCIYYGTEQDFEGGNDPGNREDMWIPQKFAPFSQSAPTYLRIKQLAKIRREHPALSRGELNILWSSDRTSDSDEDANVFAFERTEVATGDYAIVVINANLNGSKSPSFGGQAMQVGAAPGTILVDALGTVADPLTVSADGRVAITLPPSSGAILVPQ
ncbi:MAG: alpha-amylase [Polyangiaceae bacterium]|nr:alpha-amylase [Polyangiaceae bacterium]